MNLDGKAYTYDYFSQYDSLDIVVGGDHGQRKFRMVVWLIYQNKANAEVPDVMHTIKVGHIDFAKDSQEILDSTISSPIN